MIEKLISGNWTFEEVYNKYLIKQAIKNFERRIEWLKTDKGLLYTSPSGNEMCYLRQFLQHKMPRIPSLIALKIFDYGKMYEEKIRTVLESEYGSAQKSEEVINQVVDMGEIYIRGRADEILRFRTHKNELIFVCIEVKSQAGGVQWRKSADYKHTRQLLLYMIGYGFTVGYIIYIDRSGISESDDGGNVLGVSKTFNIEMDHEQIAISYDRARTFRDFLTNNIVPPAESRIQKERKSECKFCEFKDECDFKFQRAEEIKKKDITTWIQLTEAYPVVFHDQEDISK